MIDLNRQLERWIGDGIITSEQAELMRHSVLQPEPPPELPDVEEGRIPIITEILGYVGAALAIWAVMFLVSEFWENLSDWAQAGLFGALGIVLFASGATLLDTIEPAFRRLSSVLWAGSVLAGGGALFIVFDPILSYSPQTTWTLIGAIGVVVGGLMLRRQPSVAQHLVLFGAAMTTIMSAIRLGPEPEFFVYGFVAWGVGLTWLLVSRSGILQPFSVGIVLGAIAMLYGAQIAAIEGETDTFGIFLGLATAALFATAGVMMRDRLAIILGGIGIFWFVPQAMFHFFGETFGGMFGIFVTGMLIIGLAIWFGRHREAL